MTLLIQTIILSVFVQIALFIFAFLLKFIYIKFLGKFLGSSVNIHPLQFNSSKLFGKLSGNLDILE